MSGVLETMAFVLVIAGQFLAAIFLISRRKAIYAEAAASKLDESSTRDREEHQPKTA